MKLHGKTVLITGGAKRIGAAIARAFAEEGCRVLIHYHESSQEAEGLVADLRAKDVASQAFQVDLTDSEALLAMIRKILHEFHAVDVLVNNASAFYKTPFDAVTETDWDRLYALHVKAPFFLARALAPAMQKNGGGVIVNISDQGGLKPYRDYMPYCVSKAALLSLTQGLARELAPEVRVTSLCPGPMIPPEGMSDKMVQLISQRTLLKRWGSPEDVARMVVFLASQDYITGDYHLVDGGESLCR